jgi:putative transposase
MYRTYKRKLILTKAQSQRIDSWIGACRVVYNMSLEIRIAAYKKQGKSVHKYELMKQITSIRDIDWIKDVCRECLEMSVERLDSAYKAFFNRGNGFPKFAAKKNFKSISFKTVRLRNGRVNLYKLGELKLFKDAPIFGTPKTAVIIKEPTGYFVCVQCADVPAKFQSENQAVGLDMGLSRFCVASDGNVIKNPRHFRKYERRLRIANRSLSRKKMGSNRCKKQCKKLARIHYTISNVRRDFLHKESTKIAKTNSLVMLENLNVVGMASNRKLAKHILDAGWGMFRTMLEYKTTVISVPAQYTSQTCNECGVIDSENRKSQAEFKCTSCGHEVNADLNASKNILGRGTAIIRKREATACALSEQYSIESMSAKQSGE